MPDTSIAGIPAAALWPAVLVLKATLVLAIAGALTTLLRRASAALRHLVWTGALGALLVLPLLSATIPWRLPLAVAPVVELPAAASGPVRADASVPTAPRAATSDVRSTVPPIGLASDGPAISRPRPWAPSAIDVALLVWAAGALAILGRLLLSAWKLRRLVRRAEPLSGDEWRIPLAEIGGRLALGRLPQLVMASGPPMPFACGVVRPAIVLPRRAAEWDERRRRAVLCHELAHVRRADLRVNALAQFAAGVFWFHPLAWVALRRLRMESERACDDLVLSSGTRPSEYADHLLQIVSAIRRTPVPAVALPLARRQEFEGRVLAILERGLRRDAPSRLRAAILALLGITLVVPLAALVPAARPVTPSPVSHGSVAEGPPVPGKRKEASTRAAPGVDHAPSAQALDRVEERPDRAGERAPERGASTDTASTSVVASLVGALTDPVADVRKSAAYALGHLESHDAIPGLTKALAADRDAEVREMSGWALGQIQDSAALPALMSAVRGDTSTDVRLISVWALGEIGSRSGTPALADALHDPSAEVRARAAWALGTIQPPTAPAPLIAALRDPTPDVRTEAAWALGQIGDHEAIAPLGGAIRDADPAVRRAVIWALGQLGGDAAQGMLARALQDSDPELRAQAARALGGSGTDPWPQPMPIVR